MTQAYTACTTQYAILNPHHSRILVLGLGNPILSDDGIGVRVAEAVLERLPADAPVDCTEVSVGGLLLMEAMLGYVRVILVDALYPARGTPGTIHRMTLDDLRAISPTEHSTSPHDTSLVTALEMAQRMGMAVPEDITIFAVEVENINDFSNDMTPAVAAALPLVTAAVLEELESWLPRTIDGKHGASRPFASGCAFSRSHVCETEV